jgi:hypothetical protein
MEEKKLGDCKSVEEIADYLTGRMSENHLCVDCGVNTHPGNPTKQETAEDIWKAWQEGREWKSEITFGPDCEVYTVRDKIWKKAGMEPCGGCLCIGCLEKRIGRRLRPKDFLRNHVFNTHMPGTERLLRRQRRLKA